MGIVVELQHLDFARIMFELCSQNGRVVYQMKRISELTVQKAFLISRRIGCSFLGLFLLAGFIGTLTESYDLRWLAVSAPFIGGISLILLAISWIMPGILIFLGVPWLARAWFRGGINLLISDTPWEQLSFGQKFLTYIWSLGISGFAFLAIIGLILQAIRK